MAEAGDVTKDLAVELAKQALAERGYTTPIYKIEAGLTYGNPRHRPKSGGKGSRRDFWSVYVEFDIRDMIKKPDSPFAWQGDYHVFVHVEMNGAVHVEEYPDVPEDRIIFPDDE